MFHNIYESKSAHKIIVKVRYKESFYRIDIYRLQNSIVTHVQEV